jgi:virginiamycin B lyase
MLSPSIGNHRQGDITYFKLPQPGAQARELISGPDGEIWYTDSGKNAIGRISTRGVFSSYQLPNDPGRGPESLTIGPDGAVWFTEGGANMIGRLSADAFAGSPSSTPTPIPTLSSGMMKVLAGLLGVAELRALR